MQLRSNWQNFCVKKVRVLSAAFLVSLSLPFFPLAVSALDWSRDIAPAVDETGTTDFRAHEIDEMLSNYFKPGEPGATVIVSRRGVTLFRKAYGLANTDTKVPLRPELALRTGSVTKQFTAAAIMLLAEQGKLALADEIGKHLSDYPEHGRHITIENLLTHTSGIRNYTDLPQFGSVLTKDISVDEAIAFFKNAPLQFQPGQRFSYSNSNYFLLGAIIEKVSGISYQDFMQQQIFQPLQMHSTEIESAASPVDTAIGYTQGRNRINKVPHYSMSWPFAAGAMRTSVDDLVRWDNAIRIGTLLRRESWERMAKDFTLSDGSHTGYGFGWFIRNLHGNDALEHGGDIGGFSADTWRFPKEQIFIAVLANSDSHEPAPDAIAEKIAKFVLRH
jgi:CubicO group peptidase (beta-lactamase class C family)